MSGPKTKLLRLHASPLAPAESTRYMLNQDITKLLSYEMALPRVWNADWERRVEEGIVEKNKYEGNGREAVNRGQA